MPYLIDGNNVLYALGDEGVPVGRVGLWHMLARARSRGSRALRPRMTLYFDGPDPERPALAAATDEGLRVRFAGRRPADELIIEAIESSSSPRRLTVVSSDRVIRRAGRRRRCRIMLSDAFAALLLDELNRPAPPPAEPREKYNGLTPEQTRAWLAELGIEDDEEDEPWRIDP